MLVQSWWPDHFLRPRRRLLSQCQWPLRHHHRRHHHRHRLLFRGQMCKTMMSVESGGLKSTSERRPEPSKGSGVACAGCGFGEKRCRRSSPACLGCANITGSWKRKLADVGRWKNGITLEQWQSGPWRGRVVSAAITGAAACANAVSAGVRTPHCDTAFNLRHGAALRHRVKSSLPTSGLASFGRFQALLPSGLACVGAITTGLACVGAITTGLA